MQKTGEIVPKILTLPSTTPKDRWINLEDQSRKNMREEEKKLRQLSFTPPKK